MIDSTVPILRNRNRCSVKSRIRCGDSADRCGQDHGVYGCSSRKAGLVETSARCRAGCFGVRSGLLFGFLFRQECEGKQWQHGNDRRESAAVTRYGYRRVRFFEGCVRFGKVDVRASGHGPRGIFGSRDGSELEVGTHGNGADPVRFRLQNT